MLRTAAWLLKCLGLSNPAFEQAGFHPHSSRFHTHCLCDGCTSSSRAVCASSPFPRCHEWRFDTLSHSHRCLHTSPVPSWCLGNDGWGDVHSSLTSCGQAVGSGESMGHSFSTQHGAPRMHLLQYQKERKQRIWGKLSMPHREIKMTVLPSHSGPKAGMDPAEGLS